MPRLTVLVLLVILVAPQIGCLTSVMVTQPSFWHQCSERDVCGPMVAGVLGGEIVTYGLLAAITSAASAGSGDSESSDTGASADPEADAPAATKPTSYRSRRTRALQRSPEPDPPVRRDYPSWP